MTYNDFERKWIGKNVDVDGVYGKQCVDEIKQYMLELFGIPNGAYGNAIDYWTNTHKNVLAKFSRVSGSNAQQGDIVILKGVNGNNYGHIGIATGKNGLLTVEILEQNGATGSGNGLGGDAIRLRSVPKWRVVGLLRPIKAMPPVVTVPKGKTLYLKPTTSSYAFYRPGTPLPVKRANRAGDLNPKKYGGLSYPIIRQVAANVYEVKSPSLGVIWIWSGDNDSEVK